MKKFLILLLTVFVFVGCNQHNCKRELHTYKVEWKTGNTDKSTEIYTEDIPKGFNVTLDKYGVYHLSYYQIYSCKRTEMLVTNSCTILDSSNEPITLKSVKKIK